MGSSLNKVRNRVGLINKEQYDIFVKNNPTIDISYNEYISILKECTLTIRETIFSNPLGFKLPLGLGYIAINKFKQGVDYKAIDWVNTRKLGRVIPLTNLHSFGYSYFIKFFKNHNILSLKAYKMNAHRVFKRMLAKKVKAGEVNYIELDKTYYNRRFAIEKLNINE